MPDKDPSTITPQTILILICMFIGFAIIQSVLYLIIEYHDDIADAKKDVRRAKKAVADAKTALSECKKKHAQQPQHHVAPDPCWREMIDLRSDEIFLSRHEATLEIRKEVTPLILIFGVGIIGLTVVAGSFVWAVIEGRKRKNSPPDNQ